MTTVEHQSIFNELDYFIVSTLESQPYQEVEHGAMGGNGSEAQGLGQLRLDDDNEFPPMTHKNVFVRLVQGK
ncbi:hypothetical protein KUTeg_000921 [Tegillarca granosa]|uniref:Uncharacterized protein n=1 Tax=Tegillarca granosa TaxID=220873 RepID=A0ABQ9FWE6_TEGGR|nr:hypothetical protein KUTeg_000921 [Tegillarca granosa]